jgi:hypothetical protein
MLGVVDVGRRGRYKAIRSNPRGGKTKEGEHVV